MSTFIPSVEKMAFVNATYMRKFFKRFFVCVLVIYGALKVFHSLCCNHERTERTTIRGKHSGRDEMSPSTKEKMDKLNDTVNNLQYNMEFFKAYNKLHIMREKGMNVCDNFDAEAKLRRYFVSAIWKNFMNIKPDDITLVAHLTLDRFDLVNLTMKQWSGPISLSIYLKVDELLDFVIVIGNNTSLLLRNNVDIHLVLASGVSHFYLFYLRKACIRVFPSVLSGLNRYSTTKTFVFFLFWF